MLRLSEVTDILTERPFARIVVIETFPEDAEDIAQAYRDLGVKAGHGRKDQVLCIDVASYNRHKTRLGPLDFLLLDNRNNMRPVREEPKFQAILSFVKKLRNKVKIINSCEVPILGIESKIDNTWYCGEPHMMKSSAWGFSTSSPWSEPCGGENSRRTFFCKHCGRFRGLVYKE